MDMAEKIWFFGTKESLLLKARSGERYAPQNLVLLVTLGVIHITSLCTLPYTN